MKTIFRFIPILPVIILLGCSNPADKVPEAKVTSATNTPAAEAKPAETPAPMPRSFVINPENSTINFIGSNTLFGRHWGTIEHHPFLHFELCYYQAIDFAIARKLGRVEAGAQG